MYSQTSGFRRQVKIFSLLQKRTLQTWGMPLTGHLNHWCFLWKFSVLRKYTGNMNWNGHFERIFQSNNEYIQIRLLKFSGESRFFLHRGHTSDCYTECRDQDLERWLDTFDAGYIICYVMANLANGAIVARGSKNNFELVPPFNDTIKGFNCSGMLID